MTKEKHKRAGAFIVVILLLGIMLSVFWSKTSVSVDSTNLDVQVGQTGRVIALPSSNGFSASTTNQVRSSNSIFADARSAGNFATSQNVAMDFHVQVLDQDGNPLVGVVIAVAARQWKSSLTGRLDADFLRKSIETDVFGRANLATTLGDSIEIYSIVKEGYVISPKTEKNFSYDPRSTFKPSANSPVVIRMHKIIPVENLVKQRIRRSAIPCDGTSVVYDLIGGQKSSTSKGQLRVTFSRTPIVLTADLRKYDWILTLEALDGGIQEAKDDFLMQAPEIGYQSSLTYNYGVDSKEWVAIFERGFYFTFNNGQSFGRIELTCDTTFLDKITSLSMNVVANPSNSRNLQVQY